MNIAKLAVLFTAAACAVFSTATLAQQPGAAPVPGDSPFPESHITISLVAPIGPAVDTDKCAMFGGVGFSGTYNFSRLPSACFGIDGRLAFATEINSGWDSYYDTGGTWVHSSFGFPIRLGRRVSFFARPGICIDRLSFEASGTDPSDGDYYEAVFDNSIGVGVTLTAGIEINIGKRFAVALLGSLDVLAISPHECKTYWRSSGGSTERRTYEGYLTPQAWFRLVIKI